MTLPELLEKYALSENSRILYVKSNKKSINEILNNIDQLIPTSITTICFMGINKIYMSKIQLHNISRVKSKVGFRGNDQ